jgi:hypothetical protein
VDSVLSRVAPARSRGGLPVMGGVTGAVGSDNQPARDAPPIMLVGTPVSLVVTCAARRCWRPPTCSGTKRSEPCGITSWPSTRERCSWVYVLR